MFKYVREGISYGLPPPPAIALLLWSTPPKLWEACCCCVVWGGHPPHPQPGAAAAEVGRPCSRPPLHSWKLLLLGGIPAAGIPKPPTMLVYLRTYRDDYCSEMQFLGTKKPLRACYCSEMSFFRYKKSPCGHASVQKCKDRKSVV